MVQLMDKKDPELVIVRVCTCISMANRSDTSL